MAKKYLLYIIIFFLAGCNNSVSNSPLCQYKDIALAINNEILVTEIACSKEEKSYGLMNRNYLPENQGMIFIFSISDIQAFWMKNTLIPLSIAFVDSNWIIVDIQEMKANDLTPIYSKFPALYAIEANKNWFTSRNIKIGDKVIIAAK